MLVHYKCDNCGADMGFDSDSGTLHCSSCGAKNNIEEMAGDSKSKGKSTYEMEDEDKRFAKESFEHDYEDSSDRDEPTDHSTFHAFYLCENKALVIVHTLHLKGVYKALLPALINKVSPASAYICNVVKPIFY